MVGGMLMWVHLIAVMCLALNSVVSLAARNVPAVCITSRALPGRCVSLEDCPKLEQIARKPSITWKEQYLLIGASNACPLSTEHFCCANVDIGGRTTTPEPERQIPATNCLQSLLTEGAQSVGRSSLDTSFGVLITYGPSPYRRCVGSLITPDYVLTAAHCVRDPHSMVLYVNAYNVTLDPDEGDLKADGVRRYVLDAIIHEYYNLTTHDNDIALLRLSRRIDQEDVGSPVPICIPMDVQHDAVASVGRTLTCFGWGVNAEGQPSNSKKSMTLERISLELCQARLKSLRVALNGKVKVTERNICTITITGRDALAGYSGGPLMYRKDGTWYLIGIINYGVSATSNNFPVVSINVQQYVDWILDNIQRSSVDNIM